MLNNYTKLTLFAVILIILAFLLAFLLQRFTVVPTSKPQQGDNYYQLNSCIIGDIDACTQPVFIRNTAELGLNYPRLRNDVSADTFYVRAAANSFDVNSQWKLKKLANGNFQIISLANNEALRMILDPGQKYPVSCDPKVVYDLEKNGADGICAEFMIMGIKMNSGLIAYMIAIPDKYAIPASYRSNNEQIVKYGTIASLVTADTIANSAKDINFQSNHWVFYWTFERV